MKQKILLIISLILLLSLSLVSAITQQETNEAKDLIDSEVSCGKLTDEQLEIIGEYYMEQMRPGESHELTHKMMGLKEGSGAEEQFHINMAKTIYCGESGGMMGSSEMGMIGSGGMIGMMNMAGNNLMGGQIPQTNMMQGMMGNWGYGFNYWNFFSVLYLILLVGLVILVYLWIINLWKNTKNKGSRK